MNKAIFENIEIEILNLIDSSQIELKIAMSWLTNPNIFSKLINQLENNVKIELIINNDEINNNKNSVDFEKYISMGGNLYFFNKNHFLHHKFLIVDNKLVQTGSYNYTKVAEEINVENILITDNENIVNSYVKEFEKIKQFSDKIYEFKRNTNTNIIDIQFKALPDLRENFQSKNHSTFIVLEYLDCDYIRLENIETKEIVRASISDLSKNYEEGEILKLKSPFSFIISIKTKNNFFIGTKQTNIIDNPIVID